MNADFFCFKSAKIRVHLRPIYPEFIPTVPIIDFGFATAKQYNRLKLFFLLFLMPTCDLLLTNALVLTMDEQFTLHRDGAVAITGNSIIAVGDIAAEYTAQQTMDCGGKVLMPGL